jgi:hypothetical protein
MKKIFLLLVLLSFVIVSKAQSNRFDVLQNLEKSAPAAKQNPLNNSATLTSASRFFGSKDDLTTVIEIIPKGTTVELIDEDSTYFHIAFNDNEGYIFRRDAIAGSTTTSKQEEPKQVTQAVREPQEEQYQQEEQPVSRFTSLENKYGSTMAARLTAGKIWKGMNSEMVKDSWGNPMKINRVINDNVIKEEWIFRSTWLYFENNSLRDWGPVKR